MPTYTVETKVSHDNPHDILIAITLAGRNTESRVQHLVGEVSYTEESDYACSVDNIIAGTSSTMPPEPDVRVALNKVVKTMIDMAVELGIEGAETLRIHQGS